MKVLTWQILGRRRLYKLANITFKQDAIDEHFYELFQLNFSLFRSGYSSEMDALNASLAYFTALISLLFILFSMICVPLY